MLEVVTHQTFLVFQDVLKTSWRRLQRNTFRLPRRLQDVFKTYLQYVFLKRLQDVFKTSSKTSSRRACKTSCCYVFKTSSRQKNEDVLKDKKMLHWRRLQYVFSKTNVCWDSLSRTVLYQGDLLKKFKENNLAKVNSLKLRKMENSLKCFH